MIIELERHRATWATFPVRRVIGRLERAFPWLTGRVTWSLRNGHVVFAADLPAVLPIRV